MISLGEPDIPVWSLAGWRYNSRKGRNSSCCQHYSTPMWGATSKTRDTSLSFSHRKQAAIKTQWMEKTWYQISDGVTGAKQVHNVAACGDSKEKKWTQAKVPPHSQEVCRERGPLGDTGSWGYALQICSQPARKICLQTGGTAVKDLKAEMSEQPGSSVHLS